MAASQTMLVAIGADTDCPAVLLEFPAQAVDPGEAIVIRAWAADPLLLEDFVLAAGLESLGPGQPNVWDGQTTCKYFDYAGESKPQQFDFPITAVSRVTAFSALLTVSAAGSITTLAPAGADVTALFARRGSSCLVPAAAIASGLHGTVHAVAARAPYCREWSWTAPSAPRGALWFFLREEGVLKHRFSLTLSEEPADTSVAYTDVKIRVIDRRTAGAVLLADVWVNGLYVGRTDSKYGYVRLERILSGTYPVRVEAFGYPASDADAYADNDTVTIPAAGGEVRVLIGDYA